MHQGQGLKHLMDLPPTVLQIATTTSIEEAPVERDQENVGGLRRQLEGEGEDGEEGPGDGHEGRLALRLLRTSATGEAKGRGAQGGDFLAEGEEDDHPVAVMLSQPEHLLIPAISAPRGNGLNQQGNGEEHAVTPDLTSFVSGSEGPLSMSRSGQRGNAIMQPPKMFNIFLPKNQQRVSSRVIIAV